MSIVAIVPYQYLQYTNDELANAGFGPMNFTVPGYVGIVPSFGALHAWDDPTFQAALEAIPYVTLEVGDGDPVERTNALIEAQGAQWPAQAPPLPDTGMVLAGEIYTDGGKSWSIIQSFDRSVYGGPASELAPSIIRYLRAPGSVEEWVQPIDQYDAYKKYNAYTGQPDQCYYKGDQWYVVSGDAAGNNVYAPDVYGWQRVA